MNIELSKNNHLKWGYNGLVGSERTNLYDRFFIEYGKIQRPVQDFRSECITAAKEIADYCRSINKRPLIFYSGGIDSESIILAFLLSGEDFSICHIQFQVGLNYHETEYVRKFCSKHRLDLIEYQVEALEFLTNDETFRRAVRDNVRMIETYLMTSITDKIRDQYYPILDHPGTYLYREEKDLSKLGRWVWKDYECIMFYYNHARNENMPACPSFFHWSPEIISSFLLDKSTRDLITNRSYGKISNRTSSILLYQNAFPEYEIEPRPKYTGFEKLPKDLINKVNLRLNQHTFHDIHSGQDHEYNEMLKVLGHEY